MVQVTRPTPSHFGIYVFDVERMVNFYKTVFGLVETDRGVGRTFKAPLVFLSATPEQHHQLVIAGGRPAEATFSTVMQLSFAVPSIQALRELRDRAVALGASNVKPLNHGNALSVYLSDPEGNTVEIYMDTPFYIAQPHGDPLDLSQDDETILRETEAICRQDPTFMPLAQWQAQFGART
ncbi:MAG: VOC family protein [Burkholderiales bacterium]|nr:VOC family protein [Burkholderiales bacterium]NBO76269.1 VOC family protein [Betaproteobacteria bacterium]